jgi:catalase
MSDRGIPKSFRYMHGFGSHTNSFINPANEELRVKITRRNATGYREPE